MSYTMMNIDFIAKIKENGLNSYNLMYLGNDVDLKISRKTLKPELQFFSVKG